VSIGLLPTPAERVQVPYTPRPLQREVGKLCRTRRFGVLVCHRRFGKTVLGVNVNQQTATMCEKSRPRVAYIGPTYTQAKATSWDYMQHYARPIPGTTFNQSELRVDYPNQGQARIFGADNPDSLRGIYLDRAVLDEFGLHPAKTFSEVIGPTLVDRGGSALFLGTPNGKNQFYEIAQHAKAREAAGDPDWFYREYKASETGLLDPAYLAQARQMMTADEYAQEFECSFEAAVKGAIYSKELEAVRAGHRLTTVPVDPILPVQTAWDLGVGDHTAIWFVQALRGGEVRIIDYYEASGEGLPHYAQVLRDKGYVYGTHWAPHDIQVREFSSGRSRLETAASLGIRFAVAPDVPVEDGIHAVRMLLPRCYFDETRTKAGIEALQHYRRDYNARLNEFKATPVHDWASHGADAFRYLAVALKTPMEKAATTDRPRHAVVRSGNTGWMK
jgi:phage terminase large subunit